MTTVAKVQESPSLQFRKEEEEEVKNLPALPVQDTSVVISWDERVIKQLGPNFKWQDKADALGEAIEAKFSKLDGFNKWLDEKGQGEWYKKLGVFLAKLPLRSARSIIRYLYAIIKCVLYSAVHPAKAMVKFFKLLTQLAEALTKAETWTKMGAGMVGASAGQFLITGNIFALFGIGIGAAIMLGGMSFDAIKAAYKAEKGNSAQKAWEEIQRHAFMVPEAALTGFIIGVTMSAIGEVLEPTRPEKPFNDSLAGYDPDLKKTYLDEKTWIKDAIGQTVSASLTLEEGQVT